MELHLIVLLFLGGMAIGFLSGFFGIGGGIIIVPMLLSIFDATGIPDTVSMHLAVATSLSIIFLTSSVNGVTQFRKGFLSVRAVGGVATGSIITAYLVGFVSGAIPRPLMQFVFTTVVVLTAFQLITGNNRKNSSDNAPVHKTLRLILIGLLIGSISALAGTGGGLIAVPMLHFFVRMKMKEAIATSTGVMVLTTFAGLLGYATGGTHLPALPFDTMGYVAYPFAIPVVLGTVLGGPFGVHTSHKTASSVLRKLFAVLLILVAVYVNAG